MSQSENSGRSALRLAPRKLQDLFFRKDEATGRIVYRPSRYKIAYGGRGSGKCLKVGTRIIMADGTLRAIEDVKVGEQVMGPDSLPRRVLGTTRGTGQLYRVKQTSGMEYIVNDAHILSLKKSASCALDRGELFSSGNYRRPRGKYPDWPDVTNIPIEQYLSQSKTWKDSFRGYRAGPLQFSARPVPIDPYFLGIWLGDGHSRELRLTAADQEIVAAWAGHLARHGLRMTQEKSYHGKAKVYGCSLSGRRGNSAWAPFKELGLANNKHIPQIYLANEESVRLELLAGIIDTDGHFSQSKNYDIALSKANLARQVKYLADSLGFRTSIRERTATCNGKTFSAWRVVIGGDIWRIPCRVERKKAKQGEFNKNKDWLLSQVSVEPAGVGEFAGFALDGDHRFLLEDGTVTHNSWGLCGIAAYLGAYKPLRVLCVREYQSSIQESVHKLLSDRIDGLRLSPFYDIQKGVIRGPRGTEFIFAGIKSDPGKIKSTEGVDICLVEEAEKVSEESWRTLIPTIRKPGSEIWVCFNPREEEDPTYKRFALRTPPNALRTFINWDDNPWFPSVLEIERQYAQQLIQEAKARGDESVAIQLQADYDHVWGGECLARSNARILYYRTVVEDFGEPPERTRIFYGVDWGFANDPTAMVRFWVTKHRGPGTDKNGRPITIEWEELWISHEAFGHRVELGEETAKLFDSVPGSRAWPIKADNARPESISAMVRQGFNIAAAEKWQGSLEDGIEHLKMFRCIHIHTRCRHMQEEAKLYKYKVDRVTGDVLPIVVDAFNHGWDAVRYGLDGFIQRRGVHAVWAKLARPTL